MCNVHIIPGCSEILRQTEGAGLIEGLGYVGEMEGGISKQVDLIPDFKVDRSASCFHSKTAQFRLAAPEVKSVVCVCLYLLVETHVVKQSFFK